MKLIRKDKQRKDAEIPAAAAPEKKRSGPLKRAHGFMLNARFAVVFLFAASCVYFISEVVYSFVGLNKIGVISAPSDKESGPAAAALPDIKPFEYYRGGIAGRQVFKAASAGSADAAVSVAGSESIRDFTLVGIISGDNPQAIIQENKTQKTYYLNKGQAIEEYMIEDVLSDKVILNAGGQRYELFL